MCPGWRAHIGSNKPEWTLTAASDVSTTPEAAGTFTACGRNYVGQGDLFANCLTFGCATCCAKYTNSGTYC